MLKLIRYWDNKESIIGLLFLNDKFLCYTLENTHRDIKVMGNTCIPEGTYEIKLRTEGGHHQRYSEMFKEDHEGMLWLQDVDNFQWILIHIGNKKDDTDGCILLGDTVNNNSIDDGFIGASKPSYIRVYKDIVNELKIRGKVQIVVKNIYK